MRPKGTIKFVFFPLVFLFMCLPASPQEGKFEFGFHYGYWTLDLFGIGGLIEENLEETLEESFKEDILDEIREDRPEVVERSYSQSIDFSSGGNNFGFEARWYPGGKRGSFSLGLSVEKTSIEMSLDEATVTLVVDDQATNEEGTFSGRADEMSLKINAWAGLLSFRWDIKPSWQVCPYITVGLGLAGRSALEEATVDYALRGESSFPDDVQQEEIIESKTLKEMAEEDEEEGEADFPLVLPFFQLHVGVKYEIIERLYALADFGIWDGFLFRGSVAYRF